MNCTGDRLTATFMRRGQFAASRQASRSTHSPIGTISPISSASGMNSAGDTRPRSGWFQRSSASKPVMLVGPQVDERLVVQLELAVGERLAQVELERAARLQPRVHLGLEEAVDAAPVRLGAIERHVGVLQQLVGVVAVARRDGDADAGADHHLVAVDVEGLGRRRR